MANYRRNTIKGGCYFFTVNLTDRTSSLLTEHIVLLSQSIAYTMQNHPFEINAMVVLPDHMHAIWTLPANNDDYALRWRLIKTHFSSHIPKTENISASRLSKGERGIWQRRYWEHTIKDEQDFANHVDYIHINPVKHGYVTQATDWPYSSIHRYIKQGKLPHHWASDVSAELDYIDE
jgi:putative transposase